MKQLSQAKVHLPEKEDLYLPQLRTKSMSIPSNKFHINYLNRYQDRKSRDNIIGQRNSYDKNCIINMEQIGKKGQDHLNKLHTHSERKKILSQYQTVDLWKQKYSINQQNILIHRRSVKLDPEIITQNKVWRDGQSNSKIINERSLQEQKMFQLKKSNKQNSLQLKIKRRDDKAKDREMSIPDQVVVLKINEYQKLRKDDKLETILKKQHKQEESHMKKSYKSSLPVFQRASPTMVPPLGSKQKQEEQNPSQWDFQAHFLQQQDNF